MGYINRDREYERIEQLLLDRISPIVIDAAPASGVTSFLKERVMAGLLSKANNVFLHIDAKSNSDFSSALLEKLLSCGYGDDLQKYIDDKYGERSHSLLQSALSCFPRIGPLFSHLSEQPKALPIYIGAYSSIFDSITVPFFSDMTNASAKLEIKNKKFFVAIDGIEDIKEVSFDTIENLLPLTNVKFIFIGNSDNEKCKKFLNHFSTSNINKVHKVKFSKPELQLVKALAEANGMDIPDDTIRSIVESSKSNIHSIMERIRSSRSQSDTNINLTEWEKAVLLIIFILKVPLSKDTITRIIGLTELFSVTPSLSTEQALHSLVSKGLLENSSEVFSIVSWNSEQIESLSRNFIDLNYYKDRIYNYLVDNNVMPEKRYFLSKELRQTTESDAKALIIDCIQSGRDVSPSVLTDAKFDTNNANDCILASIIACREREYEKAFEQIVNIDDSSTRSDLLPYKAVLLNRLKREKESEVLLKECLTRTNDDEEKTLLYSFLLSCYIHQEKLSEAQECYEKVSPALKKCRHFGYLARNAISAFPETKEELYDVALASFKKQGDEFGYFSTLSNKGYAICKSGAPQKGLEILQEAKSGLARFPRANSYAVYNDIGIAYLLLGNWEESFLHLSTAIDISMDSMPRIFSSINMACLEAVMGNTKSAIKRLDKFKNDVENHPLDRVRQQYYINRLLVEYLSEEKNLDEYIDLAKEYPDRYSPEKTESVLSYYLRHMNNDSSTPSDNWQKLYFPCGLVYWYVDPLHLIPANIIKKVLSPHT